LAAWVRSTTRMCGDGAADPEGTLMLGAAHSTGFGLLLQEYRLRAGLTQEALAERAGLGRRSVQGLERGENLPHRETVRRLGEPLDLSPDEQVRFEEAAQPAPRYRQPAGPPHLIDFPAAPRPEPARHHNLPAQLTSFVGREHELAEVRRR